MLISSGAGFGSVRIKCCSMAISDNVRKTHNTAVERSRAFSIDRLSVVIIGLVRRGY
jgi:hypothetical protein